MALMKKPASLIPYNGGRWVQSGGYRYRINHLRKNENWWTIAEADGQSAWDLIRFNFRTDDAREVNWYLKHFVGCTEETADGKNFRFSEGMTPGHIFTRNNLNHEANKHWSPVPMPAPAPGEDTTPDWWTSSGKWVCIGAKAGASATVGGDVAMLYCFAWEDFNKNFVLRAATAKAGLGGGAATGLVGIISGFKHPAHLNGIRQTGTDWAISLGARWHSIVRGFRAVAGLPAAVQAVRAAKAQKLIDAARNPEIWEALHTGLKSTAREVLGHDMGVPQVTVFDLPIGVGGELNYMWTVTSFRTYLVNVD